MKFTRSISIFVLMLASYLASPVALAQTITVSTNANTALSLAEELYPEIFKDGGALFEIQGYVARYYEASKVYVGFKDGNVYLVGGPFGDSIVSKGPEATVVSQLNNIKIQLGNGGGTGAGGDLYDLTISGKTTTNVAGFPFSVDIDDLVIEDVPGVEPGDTDEIESTITEYFDGVGTISNLQVVVINNSESRITFDLSFAATIVQQGVTVNMTYDLNYDFVKQ